MPTAAGEFTVTVVGEIPPGTAERVALAMRPAQESAQ
jgi:negative regulator of sigma E activity